VSATEKLYVSGTVAPLPADAEPSRSMASNPPLYFDLKLFHTVAVALAVIKATGLVWQRALMVTVRDADVH
jgi:hypothetical protein